MKKQEDLDIGDEVFMSECADSLGVIISKSSFYPDVVSVLGQTGSVNKFMLSDLYPTGSAYPEIESVIKQLKEKDTGNKKENE